MGDLFDGADVLERQEQLLRDAFAVLDETQVHYTPRAWWTLFSGGHDSLTACAVAFKWAEHRGVQMQAGHIKTGTGIPATTEYVETVCKQEGWPLQIFEPPVSYEDIVMEHGFPGPGQHGIAYARLKERCLRELVRGSKVNFHDRIGMVTGVRQDESLRRMRHVSRIQREGAQVFAAPIWNWTKGDCAQFCFDTLGLPKNDVVGLLHASGECLCGAFARPDEMAEIEQWFPEHAKWIHALEERVRGAGIVACRWGQRPPRIHQEQMKMGFGEDWDASIPGVLCQGCALSPED